MTSEESLMAMFTKVHGEITGACYTEIVYSDEDGPEAVNVMKNGNICWTATKADLVFDYLAMQIDKENEMKKCYAVIEFEVPNNAPKADVEAFFSELESAGGCREANDPLFESFSHVKVVSLRGMK